MTIWNSVTQEIITKIELNTPIKSIAADSNVDTLVVSSKTETSIKLFKRGVEKLEYRGELVVTSNFNIQLTRGMNLLLLTLK